jgi:DNA-binding PadR family transcriptional regulator
MLSPQDIGPLEFQLLAVLIGNPRNSYGVSIMQRLEQRTGKARSLPAIYSALDRLTDKGMVSSYWGEPTAERGGRRKRLYKIEARGVEAVRRVQQSVDVGAMLPAVAGA